MIIRLSTRRAWLSLLCALLLTTVWTGCDNSQRISHIEFRNLNYTDNATGTEKLFIAISQQPDFNTDFLMHGIIVSSPGPSDPTLRDILWYASDNRNKSENFWLLVAEDTNDDGYLSFGDNILPAMAIQLSHRETTIIENLVFNPDNSVWFDPVNTRRFRLGLFFSDPARVDEQHPIRIVLGTDPDLNNPDNIFAEFLYANYELAKNLEFSMPWAAEYFIYAWWSPAGNTAPQPGDWRTSDPATAPNVSDLLTGPLILTPLIQF